MMTTMLTAIYQGSLLCMGMWSCVKILPDNGFIAHGLPMQNTSATEFPCCHYRYLLDCSAPDYPQFQPEDDTRYCNLAAVAVLKAPDWCTPEMLQYEAVLPRPAACAFYDYVTVPGKLPGILRKGCLMQTITGIGVWNSHQVYT